MNVTGITLSVSSKSKDWKAKYFNSFGSTKSMGIDVM